MSSSTPRKISTAEAQEALKIHSEAERRRRERINAHLATLRRMIPDARQMDKATLLAQVVSQLKELKKKTAETTTQTPPATTIPAEANGIAVHCYTGAAAVTGYGRPPPAATYVRASVSCDDRPGLHADLAAAFRTMRLRPVRADVAALGGRAQCDFLLCREEGGGVMTSAAAGGRDLRALEEGVRRELARAAFPETTTTTTYGCNGTRSRRQRLVGSSHCVLLGHGHGLR
ncbi:transcription factor AIG1 [Sorghum bicolor]|uniref:BHLH domain-containing protein n=1 Tax=Sorghum bicolor TaxID=4558 RepID=C5Z0Z9_SORBI|nr:transcription factor AIG1 [Sorghum bicolor]EES19097.1 hypothetical protein SORBI_3009G057000 [Sorghum bicolor]KXG21400.1 hypothetical protein SORBI_3009G057000 [Sorghum bicolor]|eukprot:XP_002440667.1 transcription factor AIG1 [Sorghum bicolor]